MPGRANCARGEREAVSDGGPFGIDAARDGWKQERGEPADYLPFGEGISTGLNGRSRLHLVGAYERRYCRRAGMGWSEAHRQRTRC